MISQEINISNHEKQRLSLILTKLESKDSQPQDNLDFKPVHQTQIELPNRCHYQQINKNHKSIQLISISESHHTNKTNSTSDDSCLEIDHLDQNTQTQHSTCLSKSNSSINNNTNNKSQSVSNSRTQYKINYYEKYKGLVYITCMEKDCSSVLNDQKEYQNHRNTTGHEHYKFHCQQCKYSSDKLIYTARHIEYNHSKKNFQCQKCQKVFSNKLQLQYHMESAHSGVMHHCDQCDYKAIHQKLLIQHKNLIHSKNQYPCSQCSFIGRCQQYLQKHIANNHSQELLQCQFCTFQTKNKNTLIYHSRKKHQSIPFQCQFCSHTTTSIYQYNYHNKSAHNVGKFKCPVQNCGYNTEVIDNYCRHLRRDHLYFQCNKNKLREMQSLEKRIKVKQE